MSDEEYTPRLGDLVKCRRDTEEFEGEVWAVRSNSVILLVRAGHYREARFWEGWEIEPIDG